MLVLHGIDIEPNVVREKALAAGIPDVKVRLADPSLTLGEVLNLGIEVADGDYIAKMDDDNLYGEHYLSDLLRAFDYADAELVGSLSTYIDDTRIALKVGIQEIQRIQEEMEDLATSRSLASASTISEVIADLERAHLKVTAAMMDYEARRAAVREQRFDELKMMEPLH